MLIYLVGMFLALGSQFIMSSHYVSKEMERTEFEESLSGAGKLYMQSLEITSDNDLNLDPTKDNTSIDTSLLLSKVQNDDMILNVGFLYLENLPVDIVDDTLLTTSQKKSLNYFKNGITSYLEKQKNSTGDWLLLVFTPSNLYYVENKLYKPLPDTNDLINYYHFIKVENNFDIAFSYLNRLQNLDVLAFINQVYKVLKGTSKNYFKKIVSDDFLEYTNAYFKKKGIYHKVVNDKDDKFVDLTVVIDPNLDVENDFTFESFNFEGYTKQKRNDNTTYILCVFGAKRFFYLYDLGQKFENGIYKQLDYSTNSIFELNGTDKAYFLPNSADEIKYDEYGNFDTRLWSSKVGKDDQFDKAKYLADSTLSERINKVDLSNITPVNRHLKNFHNAIYTSHSRSYLYTDFLNSEFSVRHLYGEINILLQKIVDTMIAIDSSNYELIYAIMAFGIFVIFPLIMAAIIWLMSKKLVMRRYRQYYAIGSITYAMTGLISFIVGFFVPFDKLALILMFVQAWYFIFVTFRINTDPQYNTDDGNSDQTPPSSPIQKEEFKKVTEHTSSQIG